MWGNPKLDENYEKTHPFGCIIGTIGVAALQNLSHIITHFQVSIGPMH